MFKNRFVTITAIFVVAITATVIADGEDTPAQAVPLEVFPIPPNTTFERHVVGEGVTTTAAGERLIYSNTLGTYAGALGANRLVSDDIATTAPNNCKLRRLEFPVVGKADPNGIGGPYSLDFALYSNCPGSVPSASRPGLIIQNSTVHLDFPDDGPRLISFVPPEGTDVLLLTNFWLAVKFSRNNAGVVFGTPPITGFSCDQFDFPGFPCSATLGGFPDGLNASFNAEIYGDVDCAEAFVGYKASKPSGSIYNPGANLTLADDIKLGVDECQMIAYEVAAKGVGFYTFDLRDHCDGGVIPGTEKTFDNGSGTDVRIARFAFDPPIAIPRDFWFSAMVNNSTGRMVITGQQACIGKTQDFIGVIGEDQQCTLVDPFGTGIHAAFDVTITCAGSPPVGACCDMLFTQCVGGSDDGRLCCPEVAQLLPFCSPGSSVGQLYPFCSTPGTCESVCREVPLMNCPWPPRFSGSQPGWVEGATCDSEPFPLPCGVSACCRPDQVCENLTQNQCYAVPPVDGPREWQRGRYCDQNLQRCPIVACLAREGDCLVAHQEAGCEDPDCCTDVCNTDSYCCLVEWDRVCVQLAEQMCPNAVGHDECLVGRQSALLVEADSSTFMSNLAATESESDPGFCCRGDTPGATGFGTEWFKFVATDTSARVSTCNSAAANDSLFQVFAAADPTTEETACATLSMIACSDDVEGCSTSGHHGRVCMKGLTPGDTYYVMLAAKTPETKGLYELEIRSPCFEEPIWNPNDCNENKLPDGCELGRGTAADCNVNHVLDECDIASGRSFDCDGNSIPDDCVGLIETLTPMPPLPGGAFGTSVVMDGPWLVVGSGFEFTETPRARYPLYIYRRTLVGWKIAQTLDLPLPPTYVGMDDGWIAVTSDLGDVAYLLRLDGDLWVNTGTIQGPAIFFYCPRSGYPLAIDGDRIALSKGFCQYQPSATEELVFVFRRDGLNWVKEAQLMAPSGGGVSSFGASVALAGDRLIVGAPDIFSESRVSAHVFRREKESWAFETTLYPPDEKPPALFFGLSAAFDGRTAVIAATLADSGAGAAYVFTFDGTAWSYEAKLLSPDSSPIARFGWSVGIADNTAVIGAPFGNGAYTFHRQGTQWNEQAKLYQPPGKYAEYFGYGVATDGALVAVGTPGFDSATLTDSGIVYVFQPPKADCNGNDVPDLCDVRDRTSPDCNHDDVPDDCETLPPFDYDFDGNVDLIDLAGFQRCFTGPGPTKLVPCCAVFDSEPDGDVDLADFLAFGGVFSGP